MTQTSFPVGGTSSVIYEVQWRQIQTPLQRGRAGVLYEWHLSSQDRGTSTEGEELKPYADSTGMQVKVAGGCAAVLGNTYWASWGGETISVATADATYPRIDAIVFEVDYAAHTHAFKAITGTPAASPSLPTLTKTSLKYQMLLGYVYVGAGVLTIAAERVVDARFYAAEKKTKTIAIGSFGNDPIDDSGGLNDINSIYIPEGMFIDSIELVSPTACSIQFDVNYGSLMNPSSSICNSVYLELDNESHKIYTRDYSGKLLGTSSGLLDWSRLFLEDTNYFGIEVVSGSNDDTAYSVLVNINYWQLGMKNEAGREGV